MSIPMVYASYRSVFDTIKLKCNRPEGAYIESRSGLARVPEDTFFFLDHLEAGGNLSKVHSELVTYRYTASSSWCHLFEKNTWKDV